MVCMGAVLTGIEQNSARILEYLLNDGEYERDTCKTSLSLDDGSTLEFELLNVKEPSSIRRLSETVMLTTKLTPSEGSCRRECEIIQFARYGRDWGLYSFSEKDEEGRDNYVEFQEKPVLDTIGYADRSLRPENYEVMLQEMKGKAEEIFNELVDLYFSLNS